MAATRRTLLGRLFDFLTAPQRKALEAAVALAERLGIDLYLVGGAVRDLLLGSAHIDLDLVLEGDAIAVAGELGGRLRARVTRHPRFGTASLRADGVELDLAQARAERYDHPGALPTTRPARIEDDLARRDFSINAMALRLTGRQAGRLLDPRDGQADLRRRLVRVLHEHSFQDDATRILRALRYEGRLGFRLERRTAAWLRRDLPYFSTISGARVRRELERIAGEEAAAAVLERAESLGVLRAVHQALRYGGAARAAVERLPAAGRTHGAEIVLALLLAGASPGAVDAAIDRLALTGRQAAAVRGVRALLSEEGRLATAGLRPSEAVYLLEGQPPAAIEAFALMRADTRAGERARRYLDEWRTVRPRLDGRALAELGVEQGPAMGELLRRLRDARLDALTASRADEVRLVEQAMASGAPPALAGARASHG